ncbi:hypothetical protein AG1IA_05426 [Rhizoctonia solani AG-1 IA]|uniref:Uncharacterized protein n=1 Tax=Thanatephorus cucumeris (strain AG1-IA) TaxID=983506 RepID=L8WUR9_THACA|nr:hypothetical protein AG1IA_05426 [Rhizoctonia solani AG-1 IA]
MYVNTENTIISITSVAIYWAKWRYIQGLFCGITRATTWYHGLFKLHVIMDNPLTTAELSRLRKAIQQRDRLTSQGLVTSAVDSKISSALSNLKLYLPTQTQLAAVLKDWEVSDFTKRSQITIWLQQNILNDDSSRASTPPPVREPANPPRPTFVHPPPPPPLPSRSGSLVLRPDLNRPSLSVTPTPALAQVTSEPKATYSTSQG